MEAKHTAGPWMWRVNGSGHVYLRTIDRGGLYIMDFVRRGMQGAQPRFAVWKGDDRERLGGIMMAASEFDFRNHPDARLIAAAPDLLAALRAVVAVADRKTAEFDLAHAAIAKATQEHA